MIIGLLGANILMIGLFIWRLSKLPPQIPLFYSQPWGEDQITDSWMIIILPLTLNILFILNRYIFRKYFINNPLAKRIFYYIYKLGRISVFFNSPYNFFCRKFFTYFILNKIRSSSSCTYDCCIT